MPEVFLAREGKRGAIIISLPRPTYKATTPVRLLHNQKSLTDGGGLLLLRRLFNLLHLERWGDGQSSDLPGQLRPGLMIEVWITLRLVGQVPSRAARLSIKRPALGASRNRELFSFLRVEEDVEGVRRPSVDENRGER